MAKNNPVAAPRRTGNDMPDADLADVSKLAQLLSAYAPHDGVFELAIPGLRLVRASQVNEIATRAISQMGLCIVAQGAKRVLLGQNVYEYDESRIAVYSAEVPITASIIRASKAEPYLCLVVNIDPQRLSELAMKVYPHGLPKVQDARAVYVGQRNHGVLKAGIRLMEMLAQPEEGELLAPLVIDEILIRLLRSPVGAAIAQIGIADSSIHKVAKAVSWLRDHYAEPVKVEELAAIAHMSASSFHLHFKSVTSMSPVQYQKALRLQEARQLMLARMMDVSTASLQVGYASVSQFSREYSRFFGSSPTKDIAGLRASPEHARRA